MYSTINAHGITSIQVRSNPLSGHEPEWTTQLTAIDSSGDVMTVVFFSKGPIAIEGAAHINHVASAQEPMEVKA